MRRETYNDSECVCMYLYVAPEEIECLAWGESWLQGVVISDMGYQLRMHFVH